MQDIYSEQFRCGLGVALICSAMLGCSGEAGDISAASGDPAGFVDPVIGLPVAPGTPGEWTECAGYGHDHISTESGNGRHDDGELNNVFQCINGANGKHKGGAGDFVDVAADGIELHNTMLLARGVPVDGRLWDGRGDPSSEILA